jgi:dTDP-glucose 4,6-dehydratase
MAILVTGGAGFIGSNFILSWLDIHDEPVVNVDKLTYAGNLDNLKTLNSNHNYIFVQGDIKDQDLISVLLEKYKIRAVINFAAESHVDRSISGPRVFIDTNIVGTFNLLESCLLYYKNLPAALMGKFRFLHVSTDEVYGSLDAYALPFQENTAYAPNSPYAASKAAADHLVRSFYHTYNLPVLTTSCSNNYGPRQFPEKLIPKCVMHALQNEPITIYGTGQQIRDWLYVNDHCHALMQVLAHGKIGDVYNIGGNCEKTNLEVVHDICDILDKASPRDDGKSYTEQIIHVHDRLGHDKRYAIDSSKIQQFLGWSPQENFVSGLSKTILWYLEHYHLQEKIHEKI